MTVKSYCQSLLLMFLLVLAPACGEDDPSTADGEDVGISDMAGDAGDDTGGGGEDTGGGGEDTGGGGEDAGNNGGADMTADDMGADDMAGGDMAGGDMAGADMAGADMAGTDMAADMAGTDMGAANGGDTCAAALDVTAGGTWTGQSTTNANDTYTSQPISGCPSGTASGNDVTYVVSPSSDTDFKVTVTPDGNYDPFIMVREDCDVNDCVAGTVLNGGGEAESVTFTASGGVDTFIIVDGELLSDGDFTLDVEIL